MLENRFEPAAGAGGAGVPSGASPFPVRGVALVFLIALGIRVGVVAARPDFLPAWDPDYELIAANLRAGEGFSSAAPGDTLWRPQSWRTPAYPLFIAAHAAVLGIPGHTRSDAVRGAVRWSQAVLDAAAVLLLVAIGRRVVGTRVALLAALLYAVHPLASLQVYAIGTENLNAFCLALFLLLLYRALERPGWGRGGLAGLAFGVLLLVRPTPQLLAPVVVAFLLAPRLAGVQRNEIEPLSGARGNEIGPGVGGARRAGAALGFALAAALLVAPWAYRNTRVHGAWVPLSTLGGVVLYEGVSGVRAGDWWSQTGLRSIPAADWARWRELGEAEGERHMRGQALQVIRERPGTYLLAAGAKLARLWLQVSAGYGSLSWRSWAVCALQGLTLALAALAFVRYRGPWVRAGRLLWLVVLYHSAVYALTIAEVRYTFALLPYVLLAVAVSLAHLAPQPVAGLTAALMGSRER